MLRQSKRFLDTAKQQGVKHIVHIGASTAPTNEVAHWGWHQFIEAYIEKLSFSYTHLRPEAFMQNWMKLKFHVQFCRRVGGVTLRLSLTQRLLLPNF